jgi:hypothetical protein
LRPPLAPFYHRSDPAASPEGENQAVLKAKSSRAQSRSAKAEASSSLRPTIRVGQKEEEAMHRTGKQHHSRDRRHSDVEGNLPRAPNGEEIRRLANGAIDIEFYRRRALDLRQQYRSYLILTLARQVRNRLMMLAGWMMSLGKGHMQDIRQAR